MNKSILSKSTYIRGLQCVKSLFLYKNNYKLKDALSAKQKEKFNRGHEVGKLAQSLFPGGIDVSPSRPQFYNKSIADTKILIDKCYPVIYEASFIYNQVYAALDILVFSNGKWYGYEVKSSFTVTDTYIHDAALQYWIIENYGLILEDFYIIHPNSDYLFNNKLDLEKYFVIESVKERILPLQKLVEQNVNTLKSAITDNKSLNIKIGLHCDNPYPCDFKGFCNESLAERLTVFNLFGIPDDLKYKLFQNNLYTVDCLPNELLTPLIENQITSYKENKTYINHLTLSKILDKEIAFIDIIDLSPAIPFINDTVPYEKIPVIITIGVLDKNENKYIYTSYLYESNQLKPKYLPNEILILLKPEYKYLVRKSTHQLIADPLFNKLNNLSNNIISIEDLLNQGCFIHPKLKNNFDDESLTKMFHPGLFYSKSSIKNIEQARKALINYYESQELFKEELKKEIVDFAIRRCKTLEYFYREITQL